MMNTLPKSALDMLDYTWADLKPFADDLLTKTITAENLDEYMRDYTSFTDLVDEMGSRIYVATTENTKDEIAQKRFMTLISDISPEMQKLNNEMSIRLVNSGLVPTNYEIPLRYIKKQIEMFREENLPLQTKASELENEFNQVIGAQTVEWEGEQVTIAKLKTEWLKTDRAHREKVFHAIHARQIQDRDKLNDLWKQLFTLRQQIAKNAGFNNFLEYQWFNYGRFDYTIEDARTFHHAIETVVVPAVERMNEARKKHMGLDSLQQWDVAVDALGRAPLAPFSNEKELIAGTQNIFNSVDEELGHYFQIMQDEKLLDLDNRANKAPGGYCTTYSHVKRAYIFMNSVGIHDDLQTMLHEGGHAFHAFEAADHPYTGQRQAPIEFCEVASMSMELLAQPYLSQSKGGFYTEQEAARAKIEHFEGMLVFWPYMAVVDAFQVWAYTSGDDALDPDKCDAKWTELWHRFKKGVDYSGQEEWVKQGWHRKLHIFTVPLYYIEYGIAQLGAAQVWANSLDNHAKALQSYRNGLALGNTQPLPKLFEAAGAKLSFDVATMQKAVSLIEQEIARLSAI
jgi:oligoendopeptidase F